LASGGDGWRRRAACRHADPELFFPPVGDSQTAAAAVAVCRSCLVIDACLRDALATGERHGIRGGLTGIERRKLLAARRRLVRRLAGQVPPARDGRGRWCSSGAAAGAGTPVA
jgi:hypothetical protein